MGRSLSNACRNVLAVLLFVSIAGCNTDGMDDLREFVETTHAGRKPKIEPLPEIKTHEAFTYVAENISNPFAQFNLKPRSGRMGLGSLAPDQNRRKEPLEDFPLDGIKMVGTLSQGKEAWVIVKAPDGTVHRAKIGEHMGQNFGMVIKITDEKVNLVELLQNPMGEWIEREASLAIQE